MSNGTRYLGEMSLITGLGQSHFSKGTEEHNGCRLDGLPPADWLTRRVVLSFFCSERHLCGA